MIKLITDGVFCSESAGRHHPKIPLPVPTMLQIWDILSISRSIDILVLFSDVSGCSLLRTPLLLRSGQEGVS